MRILLVLAILLSFSACATPKTEKEKKDRATLSVIKIIGCVVAPHIPVCIPGK